MTVRTIIAGNWKMHKTAADAAAFLDAFLPMVPTLPVSIEIVVAPPFTSIPTASARLRGARVQLGAQNMHWELAGAFTGEVSAPMLREFGVTHVILGHSERRALCDETDRTVNLKVRTALEQGLTPIVAVGETLDERRAGATGARVVAQIRAAFEGVAGDALRRVVLAYEPIWAIGTGENCEPAEADRVMGTIRKCLDGLGATPILYGGSMTARNVASYVALPNINGGLVGGASLDPESFAAIVAGAGA
ncbi:MAG TPA: triose-phosphate isomerase [Candidatus Dormibacteraeota bacterium]|nr:triose-phosphate isomerase [Candidatus Dormibacteraeota bacterium]